MTRPIILHDHEVRALAKSGVVEIRRPQDGPHDLTWIYSLTQTFWIAERFCFNSVGAVYLADHARRRWDEFDSLPPVTIDISDVDGRSGETMPEWVSRFTVKSAAAYVESLHAIEPEDVRACGIEVSRCACESCLRSAGICPADGSSYIEAFRDEWEKHYGKTAPWASSPLVWRVRLEKQ